MKAQLASQSGHRNIVVQAQGDNIQIQIGLPHLKLTPVGARLRTEPKRDIDLLNAAFQAVPLIGREQDLGFLHHWLNSDVGIGVTAMIGPGGSGKTRLALEILRQLPENWQGGFLTAEEADRFVNKENVSEWSWQQPTLVVVDYAAMLARTLGRWFAELSDHEAFQHPLRILLLERHADPDWGWYRDLADGTWHGQAVREILSIADPRHITPINEVAHRREVLQTGMEAAKALVRPDKEVPRLPDPGENAWFDQRLAANQWADPLLLLMAAVIAVSDGLNAALKLSRLDLAKKLATRELDRIRNGAENSAAKDLLGHLYACVTLCGGLERNKAIEVAEQEFAALRRQYPGGPGQAVQDLAMLWGVKDRLPPLVPNLLGEALVAMTLAECGTQVTTRLAPVAPAEVALSLVRSAQDFGPFGERWPIECLQSLVAKGENVPPLVLLEIEAAIPNETVVLRELAVEITQFLVDKVAPTSREVEAILARLWTNLSVRQGKLGRHAEALVSICEALRRLKALDGTDRECFLPGGLAQALDAQANAQFAMGQPTEALATITEAVSIRRDLADANPGAFFRPLAMSLNNQGCYQGALRQFSDALVSISEAVRIHRALSADDPSYSLHYVAGALNNQSIWQKAMGQHLEALASISEAIQIRRALAEDNPDSFLPDLAGSLGNLSGMQKVMGNNEDALASIVEAISILRTLVESNPDAFLPTLATSIKDLAHTRYKLGQYAEAVALVAEAVQIDTGLAKKNPSAFLPALADSLHKQALAHTAMGEALRLEHAREALASITESVRLHKEIAGANPDVHALDLANSLSELGNCLDQVGRLDEARNATAESLRVLLPLFLAKPPLRDVAAEQTVLQYLVRSNRLGLEPDPQLINQFSPLFLRKAIMVQIASLAQQAMDVIAPLLPLAASHAATQAADGFLRQPGAKLYDWLVTKLKGTPAAAVLTTGTAETDNQLQLDALRLEIENMAGSDLEFRQQLADLLKEVAGNSTATANQTAIQTGDNNKGAQASGIKISIHIG